MTTTIPTPVTAGSLTTCSRCECLWTLEVGANERADWCEDDRCPCHSDLFATAILEGAAA